MKFENINEWLFTVTTVIVMVAPLVLSGLIFNNMRESVDGNNEWALKSCKFAEENNLTPCSSGGSCWWACVEYARYLNQSFYCKCKNEIWPNQGTFTEGMVNG